MTELEFELIDALYFTLSFNRLKNELGWEEIVLKEELEKGIKKGWVKCLELSTGAEIEDLSAYNSEYKNYSYLATKQGLLEHNIK